MVARFIPKMRSMLTNVVETANKHLEDLDLLFAGESNIAWRAVKEFELAKTKTLDAQTEDLMSTITTAHIEG
jgi:hypothetical protein